jgi:hypothetical protein
MRNFQLLDQIEPEDETGIIHFSSRADSGNSPRLALGREGEYVTISGSYGALELALRLHREEVTRAFHRLPSVAGLRTSRQIGTGSSTLALGAQPDGSLILRILLVNDAAGHISLNLQLSPDAHAALRDWLGAA